MLEAQHCIHQNGFHLLRNAITTSEIGTLIQNTESLAKRSPHGVRNLLSKSPGINSFLQTERIRKIIEPIAGKTVFPVRSIYFDKVPEANWNVAWHQDTTIAVQEKHRQSGYGAWSCKQGIVHVEPPVAILENILTLRIHLDHTSDNNGALRVFPGTHAQGRIKSKTILQLVSQQVPVTCSAEPGDILLMRPLLVHASRKSLAPKHRRIIHIEYSSTVLPGELAWHEQNVV